MWPKFLILANWFVAHESERNNWMAPGHLVSNFQVCQNPPKLRKPTCVMWKNVPVLFFPYKQGVTHRPKVLSQAPPPPPPPIAPPSWNSVGFGCATYEHPLQERQKTAKFLLTSFGGTEMGGGGGGWGRWTFMPVCHVFYLLLGKKTTQEHLFT